MSALTGHLADYLTLRRSLGFKLGWQGADLAGLVAYLDAAETMNPFRVLVEVAPPAIDRYEDRAQRDCGHNANHEERDFAPARHAGCMRECGTRCGDRRSRLGAEGLCHGCAILTARACPAPAQVYRGLDRGMRRGLSVLLIRRSAEQPHRPPIHGLATPRQGLRVSAPKTLVTDSAVG
jgi:hypothetical protein